MNLKDYLKDFVRTELPRFGGPGIESDWLYFCSIMLHGKVLLIQEASSFVPAELLGVSARVGAGEVEIFAKCVNYDYDKVISRLRVIRKGGLIETVNQIGDIQFYPWAPIVVHDPELMLKKIDATQPAFEEWLNSGAFADVYDSDFGFVDYSPVGGPQVPFVRCGLWLDADVKRKFPVFGLFQRKRCVGLEVEIIAPGTPYINARLPVYTSDWQRYFGSSEPIEHASAIRGKESKWMNSGRVKMSGNNLSVVNPECLIGLDRGVSVKTGGGNFVFQVKGIDCQGDRRVARLRVFKEGTRPNCGRKVGDVTTDVGMVALCDEEQLKQVVQLEAFQDWVEEKVLEPGVKRFDILTCGGSPKDWIALVESGFGDGIYSVYELTAGGSCVGLEIVFIDQRSK